MKRDQRLGVWLDTSSTNLRLSYSESLKFCTTSRNWKLEMLSDALLGVVNSGRQLGTPIHGPILKGKALDLHQRTVNGCTLICFKLK